ncbi:MAG: ubiquinol-cytochrome c reductase iron-sulfur subunit [Halorientalis sp.]
MTTTEDSPDERSDVPDDEHYQPPETSRRNAAKLLMGASGMAAIGSFAVDMVTGLSSAGAGGGGKKGPIFVEGTRLVNRNGDPINAAEALKPGSGKEMTVFPEKEGGGALVEKRSSTLLLRFEKDKYEKPTKIDATVDGYVAYSKVCTHEGCQVSGRNGEKLHCPCHGSEYDPLKGATVTDGPAPRALPQLPIGIGKESKQLLLATGSFEGTVGPE